MEFGYDALDAQGRQVAGTLEAPDEGSAAATLRARGLFPTALRPGAARSATPATATGARRRGLLPRPVKSSDVSLLLAQLALMLRSGLTLLHALDTLSREASLPALGACCGRLAAAVQAGRPLSQALEAEQRLLPPLVARLVKTAEATGELDQAFDRAAEFIDRRAALRAQLVTSLTYPAIVVLAATGVFWFLTTQVVPKFASFLAQRRVALPWTTQRLMDLSGFLTSYGPALLWALAGLVAVLAAAWRTEGGRRALERCALAIPGVGGVLEAAAMVHITRTLGLLLKSGLPLLEALQTLSSSASLRCYGDVLARARERVVAGATLAASLQDRLIPPLGLQVVAVGEETGALEEVVRELSEFYDRRLQQLVRTLSSLVEPALLVVVGGMVGFVYLSFFQAVFRVAAR